MGGSAYESGTAGPALLGSVEKENAMDLSNWRTVIQQFKGWLRQSDPQHGRNWNNLLRSDDEAALCEAMTWQVLNEQGVVVEPNADLTGGGRRPDFRCTKNNQVFYVEATCVHTSTLEAKTGLPSSGAHPPIAVRWQGFLQAVFSECRNKTPQCADLDAPCVLAVGTFHAAACMSFIKKKFVIEQLLTGETKMAWDVNTKSGETSHVYHVTKLWSAGFLKPGESTVDKARCPISALLLGGFGICSRPVCGLLHPAPVRPFDRHLLPGIEFCRLKDGYERGELETEWI